ncbi:MAG: hypothetical protein QG632_658 [Candidatus Dependentiae bacterium]|nr:hypothetical protein [Candidatus Dependentiae bacterium]
MHYYQFNIADYRKDTVHLTRIEHSIYRDLIDWYYLEEAPIPTETQVVMRRLRLGCETEATALKNVLHDFFSPESDGFHHKRIDFDIVEFRAQCEKNRSNGLKGGRPKGKKTQWVTSGLPVVSQTDATANPNHKPLTTNHIDTPIPPKGDKPSKKESQAISLKAWLEEIKPEKPIPETDPVFAYSEQVGIPAEYLRLCWREFRERYGQPGAKRYRDWRGVFRKAVRGNWFKLWWVDAAGAYALTTVGKQAEMAAKQ